MHLSKKSWLHQLLIFSIFMFGIAGIIASGGSSSDDDDDDDSSSGFPTPTLPANATVFDAMNANASARSALELSTALPSIAGRPDLSFSTWDVVKFAIEPAVRSDRTTGTRVAAINPDAVCEEGTFTDTIEDDGSTISGSIIFEGCEPFLFAGITINGTILVFETYDDAAGTYDFQIGGTLTLSDGVDSITIVLNLTEAGDENTGDYTDNLNYSIEGDPDETWLVNTTVDINGNYFTVTITAGQLTVTGGGGTSLRLDVIPGNMVEVYLNTGGGFVLHSTIDLATI